jgi:hypothetical protein
MSSTRTPPQVCSRETGEFVQRREWAEIESIPICTMSFFACTSEFGSLGEMVIGAAARRLRSGSEVWV